MGIDESLSRKSLLHVGDPLLLHDDSVADKPFRISTYRIPTYATSLVILVFFAALVPNVSFLGDLCCLATGYICQFPLNAHPCALPGLDPAWRVGL